MILELQILPVWPIGNKEITKIAHRGVIYNMTMYNQSLEALAGDLEIIWIRFFDIYENFHLKNHLLI